MDQLYISAIPNLIGCSIGEKGSSEHFHSARDKGATPTPYEQKRPTPTPPLNSSDWNRERVEGVKARLDRSEGRNGIRMGRLHRYRVFRKFRAFPKFGAYQVRFYSTSVRHVIADFFTSFVTKL